MFLLFKLDVMQTANKIPTYSIRAFFIPTPSQIGFLAGSVVPRGLYNVLHGFSIYEISDLYAMREKIHHFQILHSRPSRTTNLMAQLQVKANVCEGENSFDDSLIDI